MEKIRFKYREIWFLSMETIVISGKKINYGSPIFSTTERFAIGLDNEIENDAVMIREELKSSRVAPSTKTRNLARLFFNNKSLNVAFLDFYAIDEKISDSFLASLYEQSMALGSDVFMIGLRKEENAQELNARLRFVKEIKQQKNMFTIFLIDPRKDIPVNELKEYAPFIDLIGLYCNVPFGGRPFINKVISSNLTIWQFFEKPVFLFGVPRKIIEMNPKAVRFYHPFFSLLSNLFCSHYRNGPSKSKYTHPETNVIYTYDQLVKKYNASFDLINLCSCDACKDQTISSFFSGGIQKIMQRIRIHETHLLNEQIAEITSLDINGRIEYLKTKIHKSIGPEIAQIGEINNIGVKKSVNEQFFKDIVEKHSAEEANS